MDQVSSVLEQPEMSIATWQKYCASGQIIAPSEFVPFPKNETEGSVVARFERQVQRFPDKTALKTGRISLTYHQLNRLANRIARTVIDRQGKHGNEPIVLLLEQGAPLFAAILGVLKAGKTYVPVEPGYPAARNEYICRNSQSSLIVTSDRNLALAERLCSPGQHIMNLDQEELATDDSNLEQLIAADTPAFIIYTSGSTGHPKGVRQSHRSLLHGTMRRTNIQKLSPTDRITLFYSCSVMGSVYDVFGAFLNGATLLPFDIREQGLEQLEKWLVREGVTVYHSVASLFRQFAIHCQTLQQTIPAVRVAIFGGERAFVNDVKLAHELFSNCQVLTGLGATETGTIRHLVIDRDIPLPGNIVPLGYPVEDMDVVLLDENGLAVDDGSIGEIAVISRFIADGYWQDPEATQKVFFSDPRNSGAIIYRSGDLAYRLPDGLLVYQGRKDFQVKIRGFRVDVSEIEAALLRHHAVKEAVVVARDDQHGNTHLMAFFVARTGSAFSPGMLRSYLTTRLPDYMIPPFFIALEALPSTPNGKVDRNALPAYDEASSLALTDDYKAPATDTQKKLVAIWSDVLSIDRIGIEDDFFALGGHSLLVTQVITRIRDRFQIELSMRDLFGNTQLEELAACIDSRRITRASETKTGPVPVARDGLLPLSFAQLRLWLLEQIHPNTGTYNICNAQHYYGHLDVEVFTRSINKIIERHEVLRTVFPIVAGKPVQLIKPHRNRRLRLIKLDHLPSEMRTPRAHRFIDHFSRRAFNLAKGPLLRTVLIRLSDSEHIFVLNACHIIFDNIWSAGVFHRELSAHYSAYLVKGEARLPSLDIQYADYAYWQRHQPTDAILAGQLAYWKEQLGELPSALQLPTDHPRPAHRTFKGGQFSFTYSRDMLRSLIELGHSEGATLFMTLLAAWMVLLHRYSGQTDLLVGTPVGNRKHAEIEPLIGLFINTLVMRADLGGEPDFRNLLQQVRDTALGAYANQDLPYEQLLSELRLERSSSVSPLFQVMFIFQHASFSECALPGIVSDRVASHHGGSKFDITLSMTEHHDGLSGAIEYSSDLFKAATIERMVGHFETLLNGIVANPETSISALPLLTNDERNQMLKAWNATAGDYPRTRCLHQLFESQVRANPEATAVVYRNEAISYAELNRRANRLAYALRAAGAGPDVPVGLFVERSPDLVICLLAVLKAGGAYIPLDTSYPHERLAFILQDTNAGLVLTQEALVERIPHTTAQVLCIDRDRDAIARNPEVDPGNRTEPRHLAYVIYTSGSTGRPKGVQIPHEAVVNFLYGMKSRPGCCERDRLLAVTTISFDIAVLEIYLPLLTGACVVVADRAATMDGKSLRTLIEKNEISLLQATPSTWRLLLGSGWRGEAGFKALCGGEPMPPDIAHSLRARGVDLWNMYGPTESTVWSTCHRVVDDRIPISIGKPIANTEIYIVDGHMTTVPIGIPGELCIGGAGLARGYFNRPELTEQRFVPNPYGAGRLYRTGDLARFREDGSIEYCGRLDHQVKVRGFRIELGEIEAALEQHPGVISAIVQVCDDHYQEKRLVAYIVQQTDAQLSPDSLRSHLKNKLPEYMVPAYYAFLDQLPRLPNGKVDRKALPPVNRIQQEASQASDNSHDFLELQLTKLWESLLGVPSVQPQDNFFDLGGHSLLAARMVAEIERVFGNEISVATIFEAPTIAELAGVLRRKEISLSESGLVPLRTGGSKAPFFCLYGDASVLSRYLDQDQPVYWFWSRHKIDSRRLSNSANVAEIAAYYLKEIQRIQPQGPYFLGGFCVGATIAYEVAQQLKEANQVVSFLALIDPYRTGPRTWNEAIRRELRMILITQGFRKKTAYIVSRGSILLRRRLKRYLRRMAFRNRSAATQPKSSAPATHYVHQTASQALVHYRPNAYQGATALFWPGLKKAIRGSERQLGPPAAWIDLLSTDTDLNLISQAHHDQLFDEPHVQEIAQRLNRYLAEHQEELAAEKPLP